METQITTRQLFDLLESGKLRRNEWKVHGPFCGSRDLPTWAYGTLNGYLVLETAQGEKQFRRADDTVVTVLHDAGDKRVQVAR